MNSEIMIQMAGELIKKWTREEDSPCCLTVKDGQVRCQKSTPNLHTKDFITYISKYRQEIGFSSLEWTIIGSELIKLYNKEKACQGRQKP